ncbi:hypothetical protein, partial [uncultured Akkermansia sp.]
MLGQQLFHGPDEPFQYQLSLASHTPPAITARRLATEYSIGIKMQFILPMRMAGITYQIRPGVIECIQGAQNRGRAPVRRYHVIPGIRVIYIIHVKTACRLQPPFKLPYQF